MGTGTGTRKSGRSGKEYPERTERTERTEREGTNEGEKERRNEIRNECIRSGTESAGADQQIAGAERKTCTIWHAHFPAERNSS